MSLRYHVAGLLLSMVLAPVLTARADSVSYGDFLGSNPGDPDFLQVMERTITDSAPLYGSPTRVGNSLFFFPATFASASSSGGADTTSGTITLRLRAQTGFFLEVITIVESGGFHFTGSGSSATSATINGLLTLTDIAPGTHSTLTGTLAATPPPIYTLSAGESGEFTAVTHIDLTGMGITEAVLNLNNNLQTTSEAGTTATLEKKKVEIHTPEPATLGFLLIGVLAARRAHRIR
jgi:hypothetical protein